MYASVGLNTDLGLRSLGMNKINSTLQVRYNISNKWNEKWQGIIYTKSYWSW